MYQSGAIAQAQKIYNPWNAHKVPLTKSKQMRGWNNKSNTSQ